MTLTRRFPVLPVAAALVALSLSLAGCRFADIEAPSVEFSDPGAIITDPMYAPQRVHLTWQSDPSTTMTVQWEIDSLEEETYAPRVWFLPDDPAHVITDGDQVEMLTFDETTWVEGDSSIYNQVTSVAETFYHSAVVEITGLQPDTTYYYRAGSWADHDAEAGEFVEPNVSSIHSFRTAVAKGPDASFSFVAAGDSRGGYERIEEHIDRFAALDVSHWLFSGDFNQTGSQDEWVAWFDTMAPVVSDTPFLPVQGNHEDYYSVYYNQWAVPVMDGLPDGYEEYAWSVDIGNTHFIGLNSISEAIVQGQLAWLEQDLAAASADPDIVWTVVQFHHPAYSSCSSHGSTDRVQEYFVPLFEQYDVDLTFSGHDHNYERTFPVRGGQVVSPGEGVVHMVVGAFFSPGYSNGNDWFTATSTHGDNRCYAVLEVNGTQINSVSYSGDGTQILDEFSLSK